MVAGEFHRGTYAIASIGGGGGETRVAGARSLHALERMAVREFSDSRGRNWRAWDILPEAIHPVTKAEDYLADCYIIGWIVFETVNGDEKRRLCPWPARWMDASDDGLRQLLAQAEPVPSSAVRRQRVTRVQERRVAKASAPQTDRPDITDLDVVRSFPYPGGRIWTVCVVRHPEDGGPPVLRFTAGARSIDLRKWRKDWTDQPEDVLVAILRRAAPRDGASPPGPDTPRRRWDDPPAPAI